MAETHRRCRSPRPGEILSWLDGRGFKRKPEEHKSGPHLRVSPAPCCQRTKRGGSIVIQTATGLWCCFGCGAKGNWWTFTKAAGDPLPDPYVDEAPIRMDAYDAIRTKIRRPVTLGHHPGLLALCEGRGITREALDAFRVSTCGAQALRWPLFAWDGTAWKTVNARLRKVIDRDTDETADWFEVTGGPKMAIGNHLLGTTPRKWAGKAPLWAADWLGASTAPPAGSNALPAPCRGVKRVLVVEGQWDMMVAWQLGIPNVLSLPNGASAIDVAAVLRYVPSSAEVWIAMDMDPAGDRAAEAFYAQLGHTVRRLHLPAKDLNEWLQRHPGLTAEEVIASLNRPMAGKRLRTLADVGTAMVGEDRIVAETPWPKLNTRLAGGFRAGQTTGLLAPSGVGKTTVANDILAYNALAGVTVGVIQLEGTRGLVEMAMRTQLLGWGKARDAEDAMIEQALRRIVFSDLAGKTVSVKDTVTEIRAMVDEGCHLIVVDNWDYITGDTPDGTREKARAYAEMQEIIKAGGAHGIAIWQPRKVDRDTAVNSGMQKGLSVALQDADFYLTMNRAGRLRRLDVEKSRGVAEVDGISSTVWLKYDDKLAIMRECDGQAQLLSVPVHDHQPPKISGDEEPPTME